ncbi:MAG: LytR C-terminal domain-containing protein [Microbacteriaceae bacterium]|nr:LytR C-terminal domain-containing protein [Microbacteriaceae bacterium]
MASFPPDRFDEVPSDLQRVGAHRAPKKKGRGWIGFAWAVVATILLTGAGLFGLAAIDSSINFDLPFFAGAKTETPTPTPTPTAEPTLDPAAPLTILNGTPTVGLATQVGDALVAQGWAGAAEGIGSRANASTNDVEETIIYYADPSFEGAARGLVLALGVGDIRLSTDFPGSQITVVIGLDYKPIG